LNPLSRILVLGATLLAVAQPTLAVQPRGQASPSASTNAATPVERGGMVNAIDSVKNVITVDGNNYAFSPGSVKVNGPAGATPQKAFELKAGMLIRFSTFKNFSSGQEQVREVWVSSDGSASPKK
jgi:hypothetical protein